MGQSHRNCKPKIEPDDYAELLEASGYIPVPAGNEVSHKKGVRVGREEDRTGPSVLYFFMKSEQDISAELRPL